jgi:hypothetical protein
MSQGPWRRRVSPVFVVLLIVAGLMVGFVAFAAVSALAGPAGG